MLGLRFQLVIGYVSVRVRGRQVAYVWVCACMCVRFWVSRGRVRWEGGGDIYILNAKGEIMLWHE